MDAAWTDARCETTNDDPPVAAPFNVKALQEATRQKKARMLRRKFMIALIVYWYNSEMNVYNFLLLFAKVSSSYLAISWPMVFHSQTRRQRACCCSVVVLCWSVVVGCCCHPCHHHHPKDRLPQRERKSTRFAWAISATPVATTSVDFAISLRLGLHVIIIFPLLLPATTWPWCDSVFRHIFAVSERAGCPSSH